MPRAIRHLLRLLLAGIFTLALLGAAAADCGYCVEPDSHNGTGTPCVLDADLDGDTHPDTAAQLIVRTGHFITAADIPLTRRTAGTRLGHWPHAPPL